MCSSISPEREPNDCKVNCSCRIRDTVKLILNRNHVRAGADRGCLCSCCSHKPDPKPGSTSRSGAPSHIRQAAVRSDAATRYSDNSVVHLTTVTVASHRTLILCSDTRKSDLFLPIWVQMSTVSVTKLCV